MLFDLAGRFRDQQYFVDWSMPRNSSRFERIILALIGTVLFYMAALGVVVACVALFICAGIGVVFGPYVQGSESYNSLPTVILGVSICSAILGIVGSVCAWGYTKWRSGTFSLKIFLRR